MSRAHARTCLSSSCSNLHTPAFLPPFPSRAPARARQANTANCPQFCVDQRSGASSSMPKNDKRNCPRQAACGMPHPAECCQGCNCQNTCHTQQNAARGATVRIHATPSRMLLEAHSLLCAHREGCDGRGLWPHRYQPAVHAHTHVRTHSRHGLSGTSEGAPARASTYPAGDAEV